MNSSVKAKNLFWNIVFVAVLVGLCASIYISSKRVDYIWRWERIPQYIISSETLEIRAPYDGTVVVKDNTIAVKKQGTEELSSAQKFKEINIADGNAVFEGDLIASNNIKKAGPLIVGLFLTLYVSFVSIIIAIVIGIFTGLCRVSSNPALKKLSIVYIELIRGTPLLVQLFIFYFFIGTVLQLDRMTAGIASLSIFAGAYVAEIVRAGIQSIHKGQMEAARSLGMNYFMAMRYIILPQALKRTLPPMAGQFISLIKDSSLVSAIAITDLTKAGREIVASTFSPFEVWFVVAFLYLILTSGLSFIIQIFERRLSASD